MDPELELEQQAAPAPPAPAKKRGRRGSLLFFALSLALLAGGAGGTWAAALAVIRPPEGVQAEPAAPVYSAVGRQDGDLTFWPWQLYAEQPSTPQEMPPEAYMGFLEPILQLLGSAGVSVGTTPVELNHPVQQLYLAGTQSSYSLNATLLRDIALEVYAPSDLESVRMEVAFGSNSNPHGGGQDSVFTFQVRSERSYEFLPEGWQQRDYERVQRDLLCLFGLSGDSPDLLFFLSSDLEDAVRRTGNRRQGTKLPDGSSGAEYDPLISAYSAARALAAEARSYVYSQCSPDQVEFSGQPDRRGSLANVYQPLGVAPWHIRGLFGATPERQLQTLFAQIPYALDVQIVTQKSSTAVLFILDGGQTFFAVYYDPLLQCYSGMAAQLAF